MLLLLLLLLLEGQLLGEELLLLGELLLGQLGLARLDRLVDGRLSRGHLLPFGGRYRELLLVVLDLPICSRQLSAQGLDLVLELGRDCWAGAELLLGLRLGQELLLLLQQRLDLGRLRRGAPGDDRLLEGGRGARQAKGTKGQDEWTCCRLHAGLSSLLSLN